MKCLCKRVFLIVSILLFFYACAESYTLFHSLYKTTNSSIIETRQKYSISVFPFLKKCCGYDMMSVSSVHTVAYRSLLALRTVYRNTPISLRIGGKKTYISSVYETIIHCMLNICLIKAVSFSFFHFPNSDQLRADMCLCLLIKQ